MKTILITLLLSVVFIQPVRAQWEHVSFPGDYPLGVYQFDQVLYAVSQWDYYRSTDFGKTWSLFNTGLPLTTKVHTALKYENGNIYINPTSGNSTPYSGSGPVFIYAGINDTSWSMRSITPIKGVYPPHGAVTFFGKDTVFAALHKYNYPDQAGFYFSSDGGMSWQQRSTDSTPGKGGNGYSLQRRRIITSDNESLSSPYHLYYSDDLGLHWKQMELPTLQNVELYFYLLTDSIILLGPSDNLSPVAERKFFRSSDGGDSWVEVLFPGIERSDDYRQWYTYQADNILTVAFEAQYSTVGYRYLKYVSRDYGLHWQILPFADSSNNYFNVYGHDNELYNNYNKTTVRTDSLFQNPTPVPFLSTPLYPFAVIGAVGPHVYGCYFGGLIDTVFHSSDYGATWEKKKLVEGFYIEPYSKWYESAGTVYLTATDTITDIPYLLRSTDAGATWTSTAIRSGPIIHKKAYMVSFVSGDTIIAEEFSLYSSSTHEIARTYDGGTVWEFLRLPSEGSLLDCTSNKEWIWLNHYGYNASNNLGESWTRTIFSAMPTILNQEEKKYIFGDHWFFTSLESHQKGSPDFSNTFTASHGSEWHSIPIPELTSSFIPVASYGRTLYGISYVTQSMGDPNEGGISRCYVSLDSGWSWKSLPGGFYDAMNMTATSEYIYAWGQSGLWRFKLDGLSVARPSTGENDLQLTAFPNPATTSDAIIHLAYAIPSTTMVTLTIHDLKGALVATVSNRIETPGSHEASFNSREIAAGSYIVQLEANGKRGTCQLQIVK